MVNYGAGYNILAHSRSIDLQGFCLFIVQNRIKDYRQKNPLRYHIYLANYHNLANYHRFSDAYMA